MQPLRNTTILPEDLPENTTIQSKAINKLKFHMLVLLYIQGCYPANTLLI